MIPTNLHQAYDSLKHRRVWLYIALGAILLSALVLFLLAPIRTDIMVMLPKGENGELVQDFTLLSESGLSSNIFISVQAEGDATKEDLVSAARIIEKELPTDMVELMDARSINPLSIMDFLLINAPNLMNDVDREQMQALLTPEQIRAKLTNARRELATPQGMAMKNAIRQDPLGFRYILFPRLKTFKSLSEVTISGGHLFSHDQRAILLTGRSNLSITDSDGAGQLLAAFNKIQAKLPSGTSAALISGLAHTHANASIIKEDIMLVSAVALCALGLIFLIFFRSLRVVGVFLAPLVAMVTALGGLALFHGTISAIVIGFGSVLIGISIDFSMHIYFGIARHDGSPGEAVQANAKPILFCTMTSCAAFGALYLSGMPGIDQLATFAITGLIAATLFSMFVLPHMVGKATVVSKHSATANSSAKHPKAALAVAGCIMGVALFFGASTQLDPDLRSIGYVPDSIREAELQFNKTWGDVRNNAVVFSRGNTLSTALAKNDRVYSMLRTELPDVKAVSIAPLLPSNETQTNNRAAWATIWTADEQQRVIDEIRKQGKPLGFSAKAFLPFEQSLATPPGDMTPQDMRMASLTFLTDLLIPEGKDGARSVLTLIPDSEIVQAAFSPEKEKELGVRLVSNARFKSNLETAMKSDIKAFITVSGLAAALLVFLLFRNIRRSCLALMPAALGLAMVFGVLSATNTPLNLFHITALPLVIGLGIDYGIFLVNHEVQPLNLATLPAVKASGLTTLASFGILILGRHPSLYSLGITVVVGVGTALLCALYLMPQLLRKQS